MVMKLYFSAEEIIAYSLCCSILILLLDSYTAFKVEFSGLSLLGLVMYRYPCSPLVDRAEIVSMGSMRQICLTQKNIASSLNVLP
jgi:hypothetical protein